MEGSMRTSQLGAWLGGTVLDLASEGGTVLAATFTGIARSGDGGATWQPVQADLPDWFIHRDTNQDGQVSQAEFEAYFPQADIKVFEIIDADQDKSLSHEEWHRFKEAHGLKHQ